MRDARRRARLPRVRAHPAAAGRHVGRRDEPQFDQLSVRPQSPLVGRTLVDANIRRQWGIGVVAVQRGTDVIINPGAETTLAAGDVLVVFGRPEQITAFERELT